MFEKLQPTVGSPATPPSGTSAFVVSQSDDLVPISLSLARREAYSGTTCRMMILEGSNTRILLVGEREAVVANNMEPLIDLRERQIRYPNQPMRVG